MAYGIPRLQELIHHRAATVLLRDVNDPRIRLVTITRVQLARDLSHCRVFWSTLETGGARNTIIQGLEGARGFIQREIASILRTRRTPQIEFVFDEAIEGMERLSRLIHEAREEDRARALARGDDPDEIGDVQKREGEGTPEEPDGARPDDEAR